MFGPWVSLIRDTEIQSFTWLEYSLYSVALEIEKRFILMIQVDQDYGINVAYCEILPSLSHS